jgi:hypothetical protein
LAKVEVRRFRLAWGTSRPPALVIGFERPMATRCRLLRQYLPKGLDISTYSQAKLNAIARQLKERPRKTLGYQSPTEVFSQCVAQTD